MFGEQILRMVAGLLVGVWVARYLGPEQFGLFNYAIAFASLFGSIAKLGLDSIVVRDLVQEPTLLKAYMGTAFWLKLVGAFLMLAILALATLFTSNDSTTNLYVFIIASGIIFQSFEVVDFYFQSQVLSKFVSICKITQLMISSLIKLYLILTGADLFWFVLVSLVDQVSLAISLYLAYRYQKLGGFFRHFDFTLAKKMIKDSWPLMLSGLAIMIYFRTDQIMIHEMLGARSVGIYSAAIRLTEVWYFVPVIIANSLLPSLINAKKAGENGYYIRLQKLYALMIWIAIGIACVMTFLSHWIILTLYGEAYKDAVSVLMISIWNGVFVFFGCAWSQWMLIENRTRMISFFQINTLFFNVILNLILIPRFGIYGAAIATLIASSIGHTMLPLFIKSQRIALKMFLNSLNPIGMFKENNVFYKK
ncbi:putative polysaccharide biosynthesis protein [Candidatus Methylopumilus turicensis]|uniref:Putative polysaccharide biosynthesis protein n=2 Tax=Candidatus Methylopumilus turicensis TaxID=1581680 RepID=A0A0B7IZR1_9PROT|nr:putative polysaccharide biosynthesis protein [Candidatus Methylopumilus turicensis]